MNIWVMAVCYQGELSATTHLTRKGAYLAAVLEMWDCLGGDVCENMEDFWFNRMGGDALPDEEMPEWETDYSVLCTLSADTLSNQFAEMSEVYYEMSPSWGDRVDIEVCHTKVKG